ncbi:ferrous iron transport protein A [Azospirillaceae bacterium]
MRKEAFSIWRGEGVRNFENDSQSHLKSVEWRRTFILVVLVEGERLMCVSEMRPGDKARVVGFEKGQRDYRQKLLSMGMTPGTEFSLTRVAPLGDPVEINVRGFSMSLRKSEADTLKVERF